MPAIIWMLELAVRFVACQFSLTEALTPELLLRHSGGLQRATKRRCCVSSKKARLAVRHARVPLRVLLRAAAQLLNCRFAYLGLGRRGTPQRAHAGHRRNQQGPYKCWQGRVVRHVQPCRAAYRRHACIPVPSLGTFPGLTFSRIPSERSTQPPYNAELWDGSPPRYNSLNVGRMTPHQPCDKQSNDLALLSVGFSTLSTTI
jgi:hypothetical protein